MGDGPFYLHYKPIHLCYFEIPKTIKQFYLTRNVLLDNGKNPTTGVATIAKKEIAPGTIIDKGIGSFFVRGEVVELEGNETMVPIGLMEQVHIKRKLEPGQMVTFDDVEVPESMALKAWNETMAARAIITARF
ncbi:hypothetical protein [Alkalitalea saponilacus]|uniref:Uncharacterized protein n=1 Tax=Alkalitalea saponilacus TaxID=889453 RepID=A0A1T5HS84_9BACT|nr:hypothetical protein [Alkalitalea saponilacus]SKC23543.1 hypothetical protein SAMN03080601_02818 [Alkalitalea saponilacus]